MAIPECVQEEVKLERDNMLTSHSFQSLEERVPPVGTHLEGQGWAINPNKIYGPEPSVKVLGVIWSGKTSVLHNAIVTNKLVPGPLGGRCCKHSLDY